MTGAQPSREPVTTIMRQVVAADRRDDYEDLLRRMLAEAPSLDGYLGLDIHRPGPDDDHYTLVVRFATLEQLVAFKRSEFSRRYLAEAASIVDTDPVFDHYTGLEVWFSPPPGTTIAQPVRWRMMVMFASIGYALVLTLLAFSRATLDVVPEPARLAIVLVTQVTLMAYVILPWLTRRFARWIYPTHVLT